MYLAGHLYCFRVLHLLTPKYSNLSLEYALLTHSKKAYLTGNVFLRSASSNEN